MSRLSAALLAAVLVAAAPHAQAGEDHDFDVIQEVPGDPGASSRDMMLEIHVGLYQPQVDDQFRTATPFKDTFGDDQMILFGLHLDYQLWQKMGSVAVGGSARFGRVTGRAVNEAGEATDDETKLSMFPLEASVIYRFDYPAIRWSVPLVPYVKAGLTYAIWWVKDGRDEVANARDADGRGRVGRGGTFGFHAKGGVQFLLDWIAPQMAQNFDNEAGVNNTYLFAEFSYNSVNDFGSDTSIDLSDNALSFGLMFEF